MRYIGSKKRLLSFIDEVIKKENIEGKLFMDAFGGTGAVGRWAKESNYQVISNDLLYFSYIIQMLSIGMNEYPDFKKIDFLKKTNAKERCLEIIDFLNNINSIKPGFITKNYSEYNGNNRKYFTEKNAIKIDTIRQIIEDWYKEKFILENEYYFLIAILIEAVPFISNISGVYGAYLKDWDNRAFKDLKLELPNILNSKYTHKVYNKNANELVKNNEVDILYLDPPYNARQYSSNYHLLETIGIWDSPTIGGIAGLRQNDQKKSDFCSKRKVLKSFENLINNANAKLILLSYNAEGLMTEKEISDILSLKGQVKLYKQEYRRFQSDKHSELRKIEKSKVDEWIFACKVK